MTVVCLIPTWGRPRITEKCFSNLERTKERFKEQGINFIPVATISDALNRNLCEQYNIAYYALPNKPIGVKLDSAINLINQEYDYDYLMGLGSDNIITNAAVITLSGKMKEGVLVAGYQDMVFIKGQRMKLYRANTMFGAGRIVNSFVINNTLKRMGCIYGEKDKALDGASFRNFKRAGTINYTYLHGYEIIDIKNGESMHDFEAYAVRAQPITERYGKYLDLPKS